MANLHLLEFVKAAKGTFEARNSSSDQPNPSPASVLQLDKISSVANLLAKMTGLWKSISMTEVPR